MSSGLRRGDIGAAELGSAMAAFDLAAELVHHHLLAVADAEDRQAHLEERLRRARGAVAGDAVGPAREDHGLRGDISRRKASSTF